MTDMEAGALVEQVRQNTVAVHELTTEMKALRDSASYGKGVLVGLMLAASSLGGFIGWLLGKLF
jgi:hypothetical protein